MPELLFLLTLGLILMGILTWGFRNLPREQWQILAVIPLRKESPDHWRGLNLSAYGFLLAGASGLATLLTMILLESVSMPLTGVMAVCLLLFLLCLPASKLIARIVEKKQHTFTVGGAFFCGILLAPTAIAGVNLALRAVGIQELALLVVLAALSTGYVLGEGLGRLACISFGCCYGKPLKNSSRLTRKIFNNLALVFNSATHKAVYEGGFGGEKLIPIQALTCILSCATALLSTHLFLHGYFAAAFLANLIISQAWRLFSETLRADFRGFGQISAYQKMSLLAIPYACILTFILPPSPPSSPAILKGLQLLTQPAPLVGVGLLWLALFLFFGRSTVTTSTLSFQVVKDNI